MRRARFRLLQWGPAAPTGTVVPPRRKRQFVLMKGRQDPHPHSCSSDNATRESGSAASLRPPGGIARELSQREQYHAFQKQEEAAMIRRGVAGEWLSPISKRYGLYDGIDEHGYEAPRILKKERMSMLQEALERNAASVVEFTDGGEEDIELGGMPESEYHGQSGWTTIPRDSALYNSVLAREELDSRMRNNSWSVSRKRQHQSMPYHSVNSGSAGGDGDPRAGRDERAIDEARRRCLQDEGSYSNVFESELLEPNYESIGQPRSTYGLRKMFVAGLTGYQGIITREEEAHICEELMHLLQDRRAAYVAEETRYCVNLYERELGVPGRDTLAFAMSRAPVLQRVLGRFFHLGFIPTPPNICQVSEMIGNFSGYPVHKKPPTIGPYIGILNLVSTTVMHLQHVDCPWFPRLHMNPRSLFVVEQPCLGEYKMGYKQTHQPFHTFEYGTRVSKDYRIEVMFATVEAAQMRCLRDAIGLTECAERRQLEGGAAGSPTEQTTAPAAVTPICSGSTDKWLDRLRGQLHASELGIKRDGDDACIDGNALREHLLASGCIGSKPQPLETSVSSLPGAQTATATRSNATKRRIAALKARYKIAKKLQDEAGPQRSSGGVRVIEGYSPRKNMRP